MSTGNASSVCGYCSKVIMCPDLNVCDNSVPSGSRKKQKFSDSYSECEADPNASVTCTMAYEVYCQKTIYYMDRNCEGEVLYEDVGAKHESCSKHR